MHWARCLSRRTEPGKAYGQITAKALAVIEALLWAFHNAKSGLCFPSYEAIAEAAHCARSTVAEAIRALEDAGVLSWVNRIKRVREAAADIDPAQARAVPAAAAIEDAAARLDALRNGWLFPADLIVRVPEVRPGFPDRLLPRDDMAAQVLARRTLTALYNEGPDWLAEAHRTLDAAVAAAYGWAADISGEDALSNLLQLNLSRPHLIMSGV